MSVSGLTGLFQTVVAAANEAVQVLAPTHAASGLVYTDHQPEQAVLGQTLNVPLPADPSAYTSDIGSGDLVMNERTAATVPIVLQYHPSDAYPIRDFDQYRTPTRLRTLFLDGAIKGIQNHINRAICNLFTTANFTTNSAISCTGGGMTLTQFTGARAVLSDQFVAVNDAANMSCLLPSVPYNKILDATTGGIGAAWSQAFIAGNAYAEETRSTGKVPTALSTRFFLDQQMPTTGAVGSRTFTGAYFHKWAVALVTRPLYTDPVSEKSCEVTYFDFNGISIRIMVSFNHIKQAPVISVDAGYGLAVVRENMGVLFTIAE